MDQEAVPAPVVTPNNELARPGAPLYSQATQQILGEIEQGNSIVCTKEPSIISPFSVLLKPDGGIRLIHDGSQPAGGSMNNYTSLDTHYHFQTIDDAAKLMAPGWFMAKVDLKLAYCSVPISEHSQQFIGLRWQLGTRTVS